MEIALPFGALLRRAIVGLVLVGLLTATALTITATAEAKGCKENDEFVSKLKVKRVSCKEGRKELVAWSKKLAAGRPCDTKTCKVRRYRCKPGKSTDTGFRVTCKKGKGKRQKRVSFRVNT